MLKSRRLTFFIRVKPERIPKPLTEKDLVRLPPLELPNAALNLLSNNMR